MTDSDARTFGSDFKRFFLRGLVILLPSVLTLWIMVKAYQFVDNAIAEPINNGLRVGISAVTPQSKLLARQFDPTLEEEEEALNAVRPRPTTEAALEQRRLVERARLRSANIQEWWAERWYLDLIGLLVAIVAVYVAGRLLGGFLGRRVYRRLEKLLANVPVFKQVYPYVKQIVDFLFSDEPQMKFNRVVVLEYPRAGIWSLGFQTGGTMKEIGKKAGDAVTIFIPSSPTPFTGYTITVPRKDVIELPISVEEAIRFTVSGGVLIPERQMVESPASTATSMKKSKQNETTIQGPTATMEDSHAD